MRAMWFVSDSERPTVATIGVPRPAVTRARNLMDVAGSVALVTGANRGLGKCLCSALLARGATKVYAGARDVSLWRGNGSPSDGHDRLLGLLAAR